MKRQELHRDDGEHSLKTINRMRDPDTFIPILLRLRVVGVTNKNGATLETRAMLQDRIQSCLGTRGKSYGIVGAAQSACLYLTCNLRRTSGLDTETEERQPGCTLMRTWVSGATRSILSAVRKKASEEYVRLSNLYFHYINCLM